MLMEREREILYFCATDTIAHQVRTRTFMPRMALRVYDKLGAALHACRREETHILGWRRPIPSHVGTCAPKNNGVLIWDGADPLALLFCLNLANCEMEVLEHMPTPQNERLVYTTVNEGFLQTLLSANFSGTLTLEFYATQERALAVSRPGCEGYLLGVSADAVSQWNTKAHDRCLINWASDDSRCSIRVLTPMSVITTSWVLETPATVCKGLDTAHPAQEAETTQLFRGTIKQMCAETAIASTAAPSELTAGYLVQVLQQMAPDTRVRVCCVDDGNSMWTGLRLAAEDGNITIEAGWGTQNRR